MIGVYFILKDAVILSANDDIVMNNYINANKIKGILMKNKFFPMLCIDNKSKYSANTDLYII